MDRDGTKQGFDLALTRAIADRVPVPVIASGGAGNLDHLVEGIRKGHAAAVLAASIFHFGEYSIADAKAYLAQHGVAVRPLSMSAPGHRLDVLAALADRVKQRRGASPEQSYTARLLHEGIEKCAKKLGEEAIEAALAAMSARREHLGAEAADVFYHCWCCSKPAAFRLPK